MNYMWDVLLQSETQGIAKEDIRFRPAKYANPYREVSFKDFNKSVLTGDPVEVNPYYRFGAIFGTCLSEKTDTRRAWREALFDILARALSELDLRSGLCRAEYAARFLRADAAAGIFGPKNAERLRCFSKRQLCLVFTALLRMYQVGGSMLLFAQLLRLLYPPSIAYLDARGPRDLLIYVGQKETRTLRGQLDLLCELFVPADYDVTLFWALHFGLMGADETMEIGSMMMY